MAVDRMPTGIRGFDELVEGGIPRGSVILISGSPGTGKTLFSLELLVQGCLQGEKGMIISFEQKEADIVSQAARFNWGLQELVDSGMLKIHYVDILAEENLFDRIREEVTKNGVKRLIIDSLTALQNYPAMLRNAEKLHIIVSQSEKLRWVMHEQSVKRMLIHYLIESLKDLKGTTTFLISDVRDETPQLSSDGISEFLCDGILLFYYVGLGGEDARNMQVRKMRWTKQKKGFFPFEITQAGIAVKQEGISVMMK